MPIKCDVLIVGAGASGSVATLSLSKRGFDVIVVEKCKKVGAHTQNKIDITEDIGLKKIVKELKLPIKDRTNKTKWFSPSYSFSLESKVYDLYFKRGASDDCFDVGVMNLALNKGAKLFLNSQPKNINFKNNSVDSVIIKNKTKKYMIKPSVVIAADGFNSSMLEFLDLSISEQRIATFGGYGILGQDFDMPPSVTHIFFDRKNAPGGYFYIAKSQDGEGVACVVVDQSMTNSDVREYYKQMVEGNDYLKNILKNSSINTTFQGMSHASLLKERIRGNVIFVGDAARMLDPLFGYGMRNSIISGYIAANITSGIVENRNLMGIREYEPKLSSLISDLKQNVLMRQIFKQLTNNDFNDIIRILYNLQKEGMDIDNLFHEQHNLLAKHILINIATSLRLSFKAVSSLLTYKT